MRSQHGRVLVFLLLLATAGGALSAPAQTVHVLAEPSPFKDVFVLSLAQDLPANLRVVDEPDAADLLVALGDAAFTRAMGQEKPLLGVHVSRALSEKAARLGCQCAAIWAGGACCAAAAEAAWASAEMLRCPEYLEYGEATVEQAWEQGAALGASKLPKEGAQGARRVARMCM